MRGALAVELGYRQGRNPNNSSPSAGRRGASHPRPAPFHATYGGSTASSTPAWRESAPGAISRQRRRTMPYDILTALSVLVAAACVLRTVRA